MVGHNGHSTYEQSSKDNRINKPDNKQHSDLLAGNVETLQDQCKEDKEIFNQTIVGRRSGN